MCLLVLSLAVISLWLVYAYPYYLPEFHLVSCCKRE